MSNETTEDTIISPAENSSHPGITFEPPILDPPTDSSLQVDSSSRNVSEMEQFVTPAVQPIEDKMIQPQVQSLIKPLPKGSGRPVANYYAEIHWENGFSNWPLVRFSTPMDGSCLFHAISNSFFAPYHTEMLHGRHVSREKMVAALRKQLAEKLADPISDQPDAPRHYDTLNGGNTSAFAEAVPEFALTYMQSQLDSNTPIGYGYMEFIGNALNKDIYILEALRHDIYITDELPLTIKGNRCSIVLYYMNGHYELVGCQNPDGTFDTHFSHDHSFIQFLYNRVLQITGQ